MINYKKYLLYIEHIFLICIIIFLIWTNFGNRNEKNNDENKTKEIRQSGYDFINPLLECDIEGEPAIKKYIPFESRLKDKIEKEVIIPNDDVYLSFYFRNLNNGPWFGIRENDAFSPASLLKVPIMMAYLKEIEDNPDLAHREITFKEKDRNTFSQKIISKDNLELGNVYTVEDLIRSMVVSSDNNAMMLLLENISQEKLDKVYVDLGVVAPSNEKIDDFMSVKEYASFFRILYNAAYLNKKSSEKALELLSQTDYKEGLVAGLNENIRVSHKFGERSLDENGKTKKQLHDCGIVYYEKYPYLSCVMTRGNDYKKLSNIIAQVSKITFEEISKNFPIDKK